MDEAIEILKAVRVSLDSLHAKMDGLDLRTAKLEGTAKEIKQELRELRWTVKGLAGDLSDTIDRVQDLEKH